MGYTRQLGQLAYLITFDGSGNITVPASLTQGSVTSSMLKADAGGKLVAAVAGTDFVAPAGLSAYVPTTRTLTINGTTFDLSADRSWTIVSGVSSFNTRTGAITLTSGDVTTALGYTPVTNARTLTINGTTFDLSADRSWSIVAGLSSFNTRTGAITLLDTDVTGALGYTPVTNARTITINGTTYDLSANRTWVVDASNVSTRVIQKFTATSSQTTFTITGGYTVGMVDVFLNGIKLDNATEFTASNGSTVVLALGAATGDIVEVYKYGGQFIANNTLRQSTLFTATAGQTTFTVNYSVGFVDVFYNGSKLDSSEFTATNGTSIVLGTACVLNDKVEVIAYNYTVGAFTGVGGSGTTNYVSKWTASGTLGNSIIFDNGTNVGINNTSPTGRLHINSNDTPTISGTNPTGAFVIQSTASTALTMGVFENNPFYGWIQMRHGNLANIPYGLAIQPLGGNVSIGTSSANISGQGAGVSVLTIKGSSSWGGVEVSNNANTADGLLLGFYGFTNSSLSAGYTMPAYIGSWLSGGGTTSGGDMRFFTSQAGVGLGERMRITSGGTIALGNAGNGTGYGIEFNNNATQPRLDFVVNSVYTAQLRGSGTDAFLQNNFNGGNLIFQTNGGSGVSERMRITSGGNLLVGQTSDNGSRIQATANTSGWGYRLFNSWSSSIEAYFSHGGGYGMAIDSAANTGGVYLLKAASGDGANRGTNIRFQVNADGSTYVGGASMANGQTFGVIGSGVWNGAAIGLQNTGTGGITYTIFSTNNSFGQGGSALLFYNVPDGRNNLILYANGNYDFAGSDVSDRRLKQDIEDINFGLNEIMMLSPKSYNLKSKDNLKGEDQTTLRKRYGFIAQEVQPILPDVITGEETETDYLGLDYNGVLAIAVKAIQEQQAQIEELKALING